MKNKKFFSFLLILTLLFQLFLLPVAAETSDTAQEVSSTDAAQDDAEAFSVDAKAALLIDLNTGRTIYEQNADEKIYPASLTKIMTCLLALESDDLDLSKDVTVSESALSGIDPSGSTAGLKAGETLRMMDVLYCMMVVSANEACNVVAEAVSGSVEAFVDLMNQRAQELGCTGTHFANTNGLPDDNHYTTARDLSIITREAMKSQTFLQIVSTVEYEVPATNLSEARELTTTNQLLLDKQSNSFYYPNAIGIKTGYTSTAGRCLISAAKDDGMYLLAIVCGAETKTLADGQLEMESFPECIKLFDYGFDCFAYVNILSTLYPVAQVAVTGSASSEYVAVAPAENIRILLPRQSEDDEENEKYYEEAAEQTIQLYSDSVDAPVKAGDVLGTITVSYQGETVGTSDLVAIADVGKSEISAAANETGSYIQRNWWKWLLGIVVLLILAFAALVIRSYILRHKRRKEKLERQRRLIEQRKHFFDDEQ